ncbi:hypothetical protein [Streptomyces sp. NPDC055105]|uniref:hypothetical protein n=1 Tax=Streptomyces sp. NPDC055105 TaxID=3365719 RepID=UPI0037CD5E24
MPSAVSAPPAAAATTYSLTVTNKSAQSQHFCLYQSAVDLGVPGARSLAWLTAHAKPNRTVTFTWAVDYSFVWGLTGQLTSGIQFVTGEVVAADPSDLSENTITFEFYDKWYKFGPVSGGIKPLGTLAIYVSPTVPPETTSVGTGMSGFPVFAVQASPTEGNALVFRPHPEYWITAGTFISGEVLNVEKLTSKAEIPYTDTFSMNATLEPSGLWTVSAASA